MRKVTKVRVLGFTTGDRQHNDPHDDKGSNPGETEQKLNGIHGVKGQQNTRIRNNPGKTFGRDPGEPDQDHKPAK